MHIETSADARRSRRHDAGGGLAGPAADDRGYLAAAASRFSSWWHGDRRPPALTADTASGAGLQGGNDDEVPSPEGDASLASLEGESTSTPSNHLATAKNEVRDENTCGIPPIASELVHELCIHAC